MQIDVTTIVQVLMQQRDRLFAYLWTILRDTQMVEDTLQELSILAVQKGIEVEDEQCLVVWLRRAARLKALEMLHSRSRVPVTLSEQVLDQLDAYWSQRDESSESHRVDALRRCVGELTTNSRHILLLRYVEEKKPAEIALSLGRKADTVYKALCRIHSTLRECVETKLREVCE